MNIFEQELRKLATACDGITNPVFAGRACYADLGGDNRAKLQFVTLGTHEHYEAVKATVLNRKDGEVDTLLFRFADIWGKKYDHGYQDGTAHIWTYNGKTEWYAYQPTGADYKQLGKAVSAYLDIFIDRSALRQNEQGRDSGSVMEKLRESQRAPAAPKKAAGRKKTGPEL